MSKSLPRSARVGSKFTLYKYIALVTVWGGGGGLYRFVHHPESAFIVITPQMTGRHKGLPGPKEGMKTGREWKKKKEYFSKGQRAGQGQKVLREMKLYPTAPFDGENLARLGFFFLGGIPVGGNSKFTNFIGTVDLISLQS